MKMIMYTSASTAKTNSSGLPEGVSSILSECRKNNRAHDISGAVYYRQGRFLQMIEGESKKVNQLMINILKDRRHEGCVILVETGIKERTFPKWQCQLDMCLERDVYLRQFLIRYSSELKAMDEQSTKSFKHFFTKKAFLSNQEKTSTAAIDVFGNESIMLNKVPELPAEGATTLTQKVCGMLSQNPLSVEEIVEEFGVNKRDEILLVLKNLNNKGLLEFGGAHA